MKVIKVMVHIESPCERCGNPASRMGLAAVLPDGRIGEVLSACGQNFICKACQAQEKKEEDKKYRQELERRQWARGEVRKTRLKGKGA